MDFIRKKKRNDWQASAKHMITTCCSNSRLSGHPEFHNKDSLVQNLKLRFAEVGHVHIDDRGSLADSHAEVQDKQYWTALV